jgi:hypothetical protein
MKTLYTKSQINKKLGFKQSRKVNKFLLSNPKSIKLLIKSGNIFLVEIKDWNNFLTEYNSFLLENKKLRNNQK